VDPESPDDRGRAFPSGEAPALQHQQAHRLKEAPMSDRRPSSPIALSDAELDAVMAAARPIAVDRRDEFLRAVAEKLTAVPMVGPGVVHRVVQEMQRQFFDPPIFTNGRWGKYE
jgi:hypothetical protein